MNKRYGLNRLLTDVSESTDQLWEYLKIVDMNTYAMGEQIKTIKICLENIEQIVSEVEE